MRARRESGERQEEEREESFDSRWSLRMRILVGCARRGPLPLFFVSVASKEVRNRVSLLFAILAGESISVAGKGLTGAWCWREGNWVGWEEGEGGRRTAQRGAIKGEAPTMGDANLTRGV
jgi:hypothetical protein